MSTSTAFQSPLCEGNRLAHDLRARGVTGLPLEEATREELISHEIPSVSIERRERRVTPDGPPSWRPGMGCRFCSRGTSLETVVRAFDTGSEGNIVSILRRVIRRVTIGDARLHHHECRNCGTTVDDSRDVSDVWVQRGR